MAYTQFDKILADHYNTFVAGAGTFGIIDHNTANIDTVWGEGNNDKGYGQSTVLAQVPIGTVVSATQWSTLITRMLAAGDHQVTSLASLPGDSVNVASNALIIGVEYEIVTAGTGDWTTCGAADSNPGTNFRATATTNGQSDGTAFRPAITTADLIIAIASMQSNIDDLFANRLNAIATATTQVEAAAGTSAWPTSSVHTINVQFTDGDAARYFFNAGGNIAITMSRTGGTADAKNDAWDDGSSGAADHGILPNSGTVELVAHGTTKTAGFGVLNTDYFIESAIGYYELGTSAIQLYQQYPVGGGVYATNNVKIECATNGVQDAAGDNGDIVTFTITMADDVAAGDPLLPDGTTTVTATVNFPATTYLTESPWGAVTFIPASTVVQT